MKLSRGGAGAGNSSAVRSAPEWWRLEASSAARRGRAGYRGEGGGASARLGRPSLRLASDKSTRAGQTRRHSATSALAGRAEAAPGHQWRRGGGGRKRRVVMLMVAATKPSGSRSYFPIPSVPGRFRETLPGHRLASAREDTGRSISCACPLALSLLRKGPPVDVWGSRKRTHEAKTRLLRVGAVSAGTLLLFCVPELRGEL